MADKATTKHNLKILSLIRLKAECKIAPVRVDFEAPHRPTLTPTSIIPTFHHDASSFTPSFILPADKKYYEENAAFQKQQFEEKIQHSLRETTSLHSMQCLQDIFVAIPNSDFCQICQQKFDSYPQHINLELHRTRTQKSSTSTLIDQLCREFRSRTEKEVQTRKNKGIHKFSKRQEKSLIEKKTSKAKMTLTKEQDSLIKGQNFSTCLIQDSLRSFNL